MNMSIEKIIALFVIASFIVTSVNSLSAPSDQITKETAMEISKGSSLVKEGLATAHSVSVGANYYNSSMMEQLKLGHNRETYAKVPEGHSVWQVVWGIHLGVGGYTVIVIVDAETGKILHETKGVGFG